MKEFKLDDTDMDEISQTIKNKGIEGFNYTNEQIAIIGNAIEKQKQRANIENTETSGNDEDFSAINLIRRDKEKWLKNTDEILGLKLNKFPKLTKAIDGIQAGLVIIGADANVGKTGLLISFAVDLMRSNENTFVLFFSGDDSDSQILTRLIANAGKTTTINTIKKLGYYKKINDEKTVNNIENAIRDTEALLGNNIMIFDRSSMTSFKDIENKIKKHKKDGRNIVVCIDALLNFDIDIEINDQRLQYERRATLIKAIATLNEVPIITTAELRKLTTKGKESSKQTMHDIAETRKYSFESDAIFILNNKQINELEETKKNNDTVEINLSLAKNKFSNMKGDVPLEANVKRSQIYEIDSNKPRKILPVNIPRSTNVYGTSNIQDYRF